MMRLILWVLPLQGDWFKRKEQICENETTLEIARVEYAENKERYETLGIMAHVTEEKCCLLYV
jgi:hypothetical protein